MFRQSVNWQFDGEQSTQSARGVLERDSWFDCARTWTLDFRPQTSDPRPQTLDFGPPVLHSAFDEGGWALGFASVAAWSVVPWSGTPGRMVRPGTANGTGPVPIIINLML